MTHGQGRDDRRRADAHAADDRAADGRVEGDDPRLHAASRGRHGGVRARCASELKRLLRRREGGRSRRRRPTTTWSSRRARWRCASTRAPTAATATGALQLHSRVNVGRRRRGATDALVVPTVFDADTKALGEIARETRALAERVRDGDDHAARARRRHVHRVEPGHVRRSRSFTAIINPPQAAILAVGALERARGRARRRARRRATR